MQVQNLKIITFFDDVKQKERIETGTDLFSSSSFFFLKDGEGPPLQMGRDRNWILMFCQSRTGLLQDERKDREERGTEKYNVTGK